MMFNDPPTEFPISLVPASSSSGSDDGLMLDLTSNPAESPRRIVPDPILRSSGSGEIVFGRVEDSSSSRDQNSPIEQLVTLPGLDLGAKQTGAAHDDRTGSVSISVDDYELQRPRTSLILLASYASAVTIVLAWVLFTGRTLVTTGEAFPPSEGRPESSRRSKLSATLPVAAKIPDRQVTPLGKAMRVGDLEVTPIEVMRGRVILSRLSAPDERRDGDIDTLQLKLRLRNTSETARFAPLDEQFIRDPDRGAPDSFLELGDSERIYLYPLALESEWSIDGQSFPTLNPGEAAETLVVSAAKVGDLGQSPILWRVKFRVGIDRDAIVGVKIDPDQVKPVP